MDEVQFKRLQFAVDWAVWDYSAVLRRKERPALEWDQNMWGMVPTDSVGQPNEYGYSVATCNTSGCLAGSVVLNEGCKFAVYQNRQDHALAHESPEVAVDYCFTLDGEMELIPEHARDLLGIDDDEAARLFYGEHSILTLVRCARSIASEYGHTLDTSGSEYDYALLRY